MMWTVGVADDWHRAVDGLEPGDELALTPGTYTGGLTIARGGSRRRPIVIQSADPSRPAVLVPSPAHEFVVDVSANDVVIRGVSFAHTPRGIHAIVVHGASDVVVEDCQFDDIGGLAIVETMDARHITVRRNSIRRSRATAIYFGCHSGSCSVSDILIEANRIEHVTAPWRAIGYGIQVKLNSSATIRNNVVVDTKGPPIMIYGARDSDMVTLVEGNVVAGSRRSSGIVIGGGPAIVRHNITTGNAEAGITLQDYGRRGLLRAVEVRHNTAFGNRQGGIRVTRAVVDAAIVRNRVQAPPRTPALPDNQPGVRLIGNIVGSLAAPHRRTR